MRLRETEMHINPWNVKLKLSKPNALYIWDTNICYFFRYIIDITIAWKQKLEYKEKFLQKWERDKEQEVFTEPWSQMAGTYRDFNLNQTYSLPMKLDVTDGQAGRTLRVFLLPE